MSKTRDRPTCELLLEPKKLIGRCHVADELLDDTTAAADREYWAEQLQKEAEDIERRFLEVDAPARR